MSLAPILLFAYNRPAHVRECITSLLRNAEAAESELFVFSDGPRSHTDAEAVDEVRQYVQQVEGFKKVHLIERGENCGLANNIITGVTDIVNRYGRVIVLEDDLVVAPYFLKFMNEALDMYADEERVGHIQACDFIKDDRLPYTFFIKWTGSWGWATWKRAWKHFNPDGGYLLNQLKKRHLSHRFDFNGAYGFTRMLRHQVEGKNNSWAIRWNASLFLDDILSLNVGRSLVKNTGMDGSGTNSFALDPYTSILWEQPLELKKIEPIEENLDARRIYQHFYARTNSKWAKGVRRLKRMWLERHQTSNK
ncbi:MAG: glycosyltransferase [Prevotella sp.]|jgi:glycosyltransferase involved in cell wall biosynthesis